MKGIVSCLLLALVASAADGPVSPAVLPVLERPPKIDGKIEPAEWRDAAPVRDFRETSKALAGLGIPDDLRTEAYVAQTDSAFVFAFRCFHDRMREIFTSALEHDGPVWEDDSVEIFLDAHGTRYSYYHIIVNPAGHLTDAYNRAPKRRDATWDADARAAGALHADHFNIEVRVPFETLNLGLNRNGVIGLNLCRNVRYTVGRQSWRGGFHDPANAASFRISGAGRDRFPVAIRSVKWGNLAGENEVAVEIENVARDAIELHGRFQMGQGTRKTDRSFRHGAPADKTLTLRLPYTLTDGGPATARLTLREPGGRVVVVIPRTLEPKAIADVSIDSDLLFRSDTPDLTVQLSVPRADLAGYHVTLALREPGGNEILRKGPIVPESTRFRQAMDLSAVPPGVERLEIHATLRDTRRDAIVVDAVVPLRLLPSPWPKPKP